MTLPFFPVLSFNEGREKQSLLYRWLATNEDSSEVMTHLITHEPILRPQLSNG